VSSIKRQLNTLTAAQRVRFPEFVQKWTAIGLSTEPADRPRAEAALRLMYRQAGHKEPQIVWCGSPLSQGLTRALLLDKAVRASVRASVGDSVVASVRASVGDSVVASVWASVRASVWDSVGDSVRASVRASVWDSVGASVRASVGASVWASVGASVWDSVGASVWDSVRDSVRASVGDSVRASVRASVGDSVVASVGDSVYGAHEANGLAFYDYFGDACHLTDLVAPLAGLSELAKSAGWVLPHKGVCWVSERHRVLGRDERGQLHCETGPAVKYPDGWSIYAWHGIRVPADAIETPARQITLDRVLNERNAEVARVLMRRAPAPLWDDPRVVIADHDVDGAGQPRQLLRVSMPRGAAVTIVRVKCPSTGGEYRLRVPPDVATCSEAVAWTFRKTARTYAPAVEA
jgi:hypothetical protein